MPLFSGGKYGPTLVGTGTLVSADDAAYIITAAHVLDPIRKGQDIFYYVKMGFTQKLSGRAVLTKPDNGKSRSDDRLDISVIRIDGPESPPFPEVEKYPIQLAALKSHALPRTAKEYLLVGVPASKASLKHRSRILNLLPYSYRNGSVPESEYAEIGLSPRMHIALGFNQRRVIDSNGRFINAPNLRGMSGSPVWLVYEDGIDVNQLIAPPIVGIFIEHRKNHKVLVATDIGVALDAMKNIA